MLKKYLLPVTVIATGIFVNLSCKPRKSEVLWNTTFPVIGSQSSPRTTDLNKDGTLDIVMGAGQNEYQHSEQGILAIDGKNGKLLWQHETHDQVYGSATFLDINGDGINDVFIGGRSTNFKALDGKTGKTIWEYTYHFENDSILKYARFNFQNCVLVPDKNGDKLPDLLVQNGGNAKAAPNSTKDRYPGVLMVIDSKTGNIVAADMMPDGKESYMSPLYFKQPNGEEFVLFGTGGETIDGHLYVASLNDLMERKLSKATLIASEEGHGFIAPPSLADITEDGFLDIVAISHGSSIFAIDGKNYTSLWKRVIPNTESSNGFAVGYFNKDDIPDFFTFVSKGAWPQSTGSVQIMLDGKTGHIAYENNLGCTGFSSPVVYDLNDDGQDEAIISINEYDCNRGYVNRSKLEIKNKLIAINFKSGIIQTIEELPRFKNIFSTPWIGDLDQDSYLDVIHCQYFSPSSDLLTFLGMQVKRISLPIKVKKPVLWGAYMGSKGDGIFQNEKP